MQDPDERRGNFLFGFDGDVGLEDFAEQRVVHSQILEEFFVHGHGQDFHSLPFGLDAENGDFRCFTDPRGRE